MLVNPLDFDSVDVGFMPDGQTRIGALSRLLEFRQRIALRQILASDRVRDVVHLIVSRDYSLHGDRVDLLAVLDRQRRCVPDCVAHGKLRCSI